MDAAAGRAEYADARFVRTQSERLSTRNGDVDQVDSDDCEGIGVRVRVGGAWGFAAVRGTGKADAEAALDRALAVAAAQPASRGAALAARAARARHLREPGRARPVRGAARGQAGGAVRRRTPGCAASPRSRVTLARFQALRVHKLFASTEGALCEQVLTECGGGMAAVAVADDESPGPLLSRVARGPHGAGRLRALPRARPRPARRRACPPRPWRC